MSYIFGLAEQDQRNMADLAARNPIDGSVEPGFWDGSLDIALPSLGRGVFELSQAVDAGLTNLWVGALDVAAGALLPEPKTGDSFSVTSRERFLREEQAIQDARIINELRPNPETTGLAAQVVGEVAAIIPRTIAGFAVAGPVGGAVAAGGPAGYSSAVVAESEGIDPTTAAQKGLIDAAVTGVGAIMPAARFVGRLAPDAAITVGANVGLGMAGRGGTAELLESRGYKEQAQQYKALDGSAIAVDAVLGAAFWGVGRAFTKSLPPAETDAALSANNALHHQNGTAPGAPVDPSSAVSHQRALDLAIQQISRGEPVNVAGLVDDAVFIRADNADGFGPTEAQARQQALNEVLPRVKAELEATSARIFPASQLRAEADSIRLQMDRLDGSFRRLAKEFQSQRMGRKQAESAARKAITDERQQMEARIDEIDGFLKTNREVEQARSDLAKINRGEIPESIERRINELSSEIRQAFKQTELARSITPDQGRGLMRVAQKEWEQLIRAQSDDAETSVGPAIRSDADGVALDRQAMADPQAASQAAPPITEDLISEPVVPALGHPKATTEQASQPQTRIAVGDSIDDIDAALPALVDAVMSGERDIQVPTGAFDAEGNPITTSARELLAEADAGIARAENDSQGFIAAALCALRFGG